MPSEAYVYDAVRTPRGRGRDTGALHGVKPISLVVGLIDALRERNPGLDVGRLEDLLLGIVTPVGEQGGDLARAAALLAGLPDEVGGVQLNRFCASGLEAVNSAAARIRSGWEHLLLAAWGGVDVPGADGLRRRGLGHRPADRPGHVVRAAGRQRRPDRDPGGLHPRRRGRLRAAVAGAGRQGDGRRVLRPLGGTGP